MTEFREMLEIVVAKRDLSNKGVEQSPMSGTNSTPPPPKNNAPQPPPGWTPRVPPWPTTGQSSNDSHTWIPHTTSLIVPRQYKIDLPKFNGENFRGWVLKLHQYFEAERVPDDSRIRVAMLGLEGDALEWHQYLINTMGDINAVPWTNYATAMRERFASDEFSDPLAELVALKHTGTVTEFYRDFVSIFDLMNMSDSQGLSIFTGNLKVEVARQLKLYRPQTLNQGYLYAKILEDNMDPSPKRTSFGRTTYTSSSTLQTPTVHFPQLSMNAQSNTPPPPTFTNTKTQP
ncbi:Retrotransposon gag protein [Corchorus olitorius]|uniref:Retrotransposon gag protein n=1 Tax=Corchorus olitorius TaxID=93759 RepID=A0A1R3G4P9_9ROSI|nr:Retrotransposon gag protein [Corchorus olitorius]